MKRTTASIPFAALFFGVVSGCAPSADNGATSSIAEDLTIRVCPESVTLDSRGDPRNAAGHIRYCWPHQNHCYCDQDNDCYATQGHRACTPPGGSSDAAASTDATPVTAHDAGQPAPSADAGTPVPPHDAGTPVPVADAGTPVPPHDAGTPTPTPVPVADAGTPAPTPVPSGASTLVGGCQVFPLDNAWNQDVSALPVHPNSNAIIANIQANGETAIKADFGSNTTYGIPYVVVPSTQAMVPISFNEYPSESDPGPYPVPSNAVIEGGNDHHVLVLQQGSCMLYEMYHSARSGSGWTAGSGAVWNLGSNALRPLRWTSADQGGLPVFAGLTRYDEVTSGAIHHALRVTFNHTRDGFILPATHPGGSADANAPPMGLRLRLKASFNISSYTGESRVILETLRRYGMIVADTGSNWYVSGATDARWNDTDLQQLTQVPGTAFEAVDTGAFQQ